MDYGCEYALGIYPVDKLFEWHHKHSSNYGAYTYVCICFAMQANLKFFFVALQIATNDRCTYCKRVIVNVMEYTYANLEC